ncbi:MAG: UvrB/UvrC motif-containing protein, partial [Micromonosporaceae bacterium]
FNVANGVDPQPLRKKIGDILDDIYREADENEALVGRTVVGGGGRQMSRGKGPVKETRSRGRAVHTATAGMARAELAQLIQELTDQMLAAARELQFELAARIRDEIGEMKKELRAMDLTGVR